MIESRSQSPDGSDEDPQDWDPGEAGWRRIGLIGAKDGPLLVFLRRCPDDPRCLVDLVAGRPTDDALPREAFETGSGRALRSERLVSRLVGLGCQETAVRSFLATGAASFDCILGPSLDWPGSDWERLGTVSWSEGTGETVWARPSTDRAGWDLRLYPAGEDEGVQSSWIEDPPADVTLKQAVWRKFGFDRYRADAGDC